MHPIQAFVLGVIEGLTEFLPVSSTGHLILVGHWLGVDGPGQKEYADAFEVVIQLGAIGAVAVYYRRLLAMRLTGLLRRDPDAVRLTVALLLAFVPVAVVGLLLHDVIERHLFGPTPVALALIVGGLVMLAVEWIRRRRGHEGADGLTHVTHGRAMMIGLGQCFSLWPGTSRSMTTIVAGQVSGLSTATAAEFSFLLALLTLGAATVYKLLKARDVLLGPEGSALSLAVGLGVSFAVALAVIAAFLRYLKRWGLAPFAYYRIALGALVFALA